MGGPAPAGTDPSAPVPGADGPGPSPERHAHGDSSAVTLGVDLDRVRGVLILSSALLTASAVAVSGCIGFVGLVIPHLVRSVVGADHRRLIPLSACAGPSL